MEESISALVVEARGPTVCWKGTKAQRKKRAAEPYFVGAK